MIFAQFMDISFLSDGQPVEPNGPVEVTITYNTPIELPMFFQSYTVHFSETGVEVLPAQVTQADGVTRFTHTQDSFSVIANVITIPKARNAADTGPKALPVDYFVNIDGQWTCVGSTKTGWYGDYNVTDWSDFNRDYVTVAQVESILKDYGFRSGGDLNKKVAYQQKAGNTLVHADVNTPVEIGGQQIVPLSRNGDHPGYNLYYMPGNNPSGFSGTELANLPMEGSRFYSVKIYGTQGQLIHSQLLKEGTSFTYDASAAGVTNWQVSNGSVVTTQSGPSLRIDSVQGPVRISPSEGAANGSHSVTFKVMVDGQWKTVGSLPYYYTDSGHAAITTGMATQFFGPYGYTAGKPIGYSYNDIYEIYFKDSNYCMDIAGGTIAEGTKIQLWEANHSDAQVFRIWDAEEGYSFITPVTNSGLHVNILGGGSANDAPIALHGATDGSSRWKLKYEGAYVSFWTKNAPDSAVIDLDSGNIANGTKIHIWNGTENRYWRLDQQYRISNQTTTNGSKIVTSLETNGDIVCYYLPAETNHTLSNAKESDIGSGNSLWSVSVRDDGHAVYSEGELSGFVQYKPNGGSATVTVKNGEGILWSCVGKNGKPVQVTEQQSGGLTTFSITGIDQPIEIVATKVNPSFTVQYYAYIPRMASSGGDASLPVIDTSGKNLPKNHQDLTLRTLQLERMNALTNQNRGDATQLYKLKTITELTKLYSDESFQYNTSPELTYFNKLKSNENFALSWVGVLKDGKDPANKNDADWDWYDVTNGISFTNVAAEANDTTVLIADGAVLRLLFNTTDSSYENGTTFYDYNISSGYSDGWRTGITGINSKENYGTSRNGQRSWDSYADVFAVGNANCGTGMSGYLFDGCTLNKYNVNSYAGCTFGLVDGLNAADGTIRYNEWLVVPNLFNEGDAQGKQTYGGSSLTFHRVGDTYTLNSATLKNADGSRSTLNHELQYFFNPSPNSGTIYDESYEYGAIYTNNFWPMDPANAAGKTDGLWGEYGVDQRFQGFEESNNGQWAGRDFKLPKGDDGRNHNWFFGMNFAISFNLTADYVGPLEYTFFGDDDLWVFLDGQLVCDIGGVHSSVGEYVNLRDYLPVGSSGQHTLSFFYTERGASGSTCWMQFTLPSVSSATTGQEVGSLDISKKLEHIGNADFSQREYAFRLELLETENGAPLSGRYAYTIHKPDGTEDYGVISSGSTLILHKDENAVISGIPSGTFYRVTEQTTEGYHTTVNGSVGYIASGNIANGNTSAAAFVNTLHHELPKTGGAGTTPYTLGGALLIGCAGLLLLYRKHKRGKKDAVSC